MLNGAFYSVNKYTVYKKDDSESKTGWAGGMANPPRKNLQETTAATPSAASMCPYTPQVVYDLIDCVVVDTMISPI